MSSNQRLLLSRRSFNFGLTSLAFSGLAACAQRPQGAPIAAAPGHGPLLPDPDGLIDLPRGFAYRIISRHGDRMDDGFVVPDRCDGMGAFALDRDRTILVRNHELRPRNVDTGPFGGGGASPTGVRAFDSNAAGPLPGGTTTLVYNHRTGRVESQHLSLVGTVLNCAGGITPWGSWLTCEETEEVPGEADVVRPHGFVFEVPAAATGLVDPVPLKAMGRFEHEAVCVDPRTGVVYLTEDKNDSLFYRFLPHRPGRLAEGGRLQALAIQQHDGFDTRNQDAAAWAVGDWREARWIDLEDVEAPNADLRHRGHADGAALFARGEGIVWGDGELYLTATAGGPLRRGQILRYVPSPAEGRPDEIRTPGRLQLFLESADERVMNMGDNLTVAPWGHLVVCEDNYSRDIRNHLKGVTPDGRTYTIGRNVFTGNSEFAGACFSPDGEVLFVNIMYPGVTFAIRGPWTSVRT